VGLAFDEINMLNPNNYSPGLVDISFKRTPNDEEDLN